jgi:hypothetical protein
MLQQQHQILDCILQSNYRHPVFLRALLRRAYLQHVVEDGRLRLEVESLDVKVDDDVGLV